MKLSELVLEHGGYCLLSVEVWRNKTGAWGWFVQWEGARGDVHQFSERGTLPDSPMGEHTAIILDTVKGWFGAFPDGGLGCQISAGDARGGAGGVEFDTLDTLQTTPPDWANPFLELSERLQAMGSES
jgi:hypothetical protein